MNTTIKGDDGKARCQWCGAAPEFLNYHDTEWGFPVDDDRRLFEKISGFNQRDINRLLKNEGIVRHRGKIEAVINNAKRAKELIKQEGSLAAFFWRYEPNEKQLAEPQTVSTSAESITLSKDLKKPGWKFVGPTTAYAFMQAMGMVNDHVDGGIIRSKVTHARKNFKRPRASK